MGCTVLFFIYENYLLNMQDVCNLSSIVKTGSFYDRCRDNTINVICPN